MPRSRRRPPQRVRRFPCSAIAWAACWRWPWRSAASARSLLSRSSRRRGIFMPSRSNRRACSAASPVCSTPASRPWVSCRSTCCRRSLPASIRCSRCASSVASPGSIRQGPRRANSSRSRIGSTTACRSPCRWRARLSASGMGQTHLQAAPGGWPARRSRRRASIVPPSSSCRRAIASCRRRLPPPWQPR